MNYYNEFDPKAAAWLRELMRRGLIADGHVDTRSIVDVTAGDLAGYRQCHFFAGIGGWSAAFRLAGVGDDEEADSASCPCQPFSYARLGAGVLDPRHLWPYLFPLLEKRRPPVVYGEQVASKAALGWLDGVQSDMESEGYAFGAFDLCAAGVGAPHIRQRLFWVADADVGGLGSDQRNVRPGQQDTSENVQAGRMGNNNSAGLEERPQSARGIPVGEERPPSGSSSSLGNSAWGDYDIIHMLDGKARRVEPGTFPLAHGVSGRVGLLRGYGNAINPVLAAEFIKAHRGT